MKRLLLLLPLLLLTSCDVKSKWDYFDEINSKLDNIINKINNNAYIFKVEEHYTAYLTSEVQEKTHDPYLAYCKSEINECFIEVPYGDTREELNLVHTGYIITYELEVDGKDYTVSNNGWALYEHKV